jgi:hypothetical protein
LISDPLKAGKNAAISERNARESKSKSTTKDNAVVQILLKLENAIK